MKKSPFQQSGKQQNKTKKEEKRTTEKNAKGLAIENFLEKR